MNTDDVSLLEGLATTRAIRRFTAEQMGDEDLAAILFAATRAPTGSNRQNFRFVVLRDGPTARRAKHMLAAAFQKGWAEKSGRESYGTGSGTDPNSPKARMAKAMAHFVEHFAETPVVVIPCLRTRHDALIDGASIYPACQNLLLAARALGWGGVLTGWHGSVESELRDLLEIPEDVQIAATIPLGRPVGGHGPVRRRPLKELVYDDVWGGDATWAVDPPGTRFAGRPPV